MKLPTWVREECTQTMREELPGGALGEEYTETTVSYRCEEPAEMAFKHRCNLAGFNLPEFDQWLATHPEGDGKNRMLATRTLAKAAASHWELRAHLQALRANQVHVDRVDYLKPLASEGVKAKDTRTRAAETTNAKARLKNAKRNELLAKRARLLILAGEATPRTVSGVLVEQDRADGLGVKAIREILKEAGVR